MAQKIQIRRGLASARTSITPDSGELCYDTDTKQLYVGDGSTAGGVQVTGGSGGSSSAAWGSITGTLSAQTDVQSALNAKAASTHTHTLSAVTDAGTAAALDAPSSGNASASELVKGNDTRLSDARTPTTHTHSISDITSLQTTLDAKAASTHTHTLSGITDAGTLAGLSAVQASHVDSQSATDGFVLTADGSGNAAWEAASGGGSGLADVVDDASPQLGGNLDVNGNAIAATTSAQQLNIHINQSSASPGNDYTDYASEACIAIHNTGDANGADVLRIAANGNDAVLAAKDKMSISAENAINFRPDASASVVLSLGATDHKVYKPFFLSTQVSDPSIAGNFACIYAKDVSSSAEVFVMDEAGNVTQISEHNREAPAWLYDDADGMPDNVKRMHNLFSGYVQFVNNTRRDNVMALTSTARDALSENKRVWKHTETFAQYNTRRGLTAGDAGYLESRDWDSEETRKQADATTRGETYTKRSKPQWLRATLGEV